MEPKLNTKLLSLEYGPESDHRLVAGQAEGVDLVCGIERTVTVRIHNPLSVPEDADPLLPFTVPVTYHRRVTSQTKRKDVVQRPPRAVTVAVHDPQANT